MNEPVRVDPELQRILDALTVMGIRVELNVLFRLRPETVGETYCGRTREFVSTLVARVANETGINPIYHVLMWGVFFIVRASTDFIRKMIEQPEIASAIAERVIPEWQKGWFPVKPIRLTAVGLFPVKPIRLTIGFAVVESPHSRRNGDGFTTT